MTVAAAMLLFAIWISAPGPAIIGPETQFELGLRPEMPPHCRPATKAERWDRNLNPQGKAATYSLAGEYYCESEIFRYGERHSFYDFASRHAGPRIVQSVKKMAYEFSSLEAWAVRIESEDPRLSGYLQNSFEVELARVLGSRKVVRFGSGGSRAAEVAVRVNRVADPELFLEVFVIHENDLGKKLWRAY